MSTFELWSLRISGAGFTVSLIVLAFLVWQLWLLSRQLKLAREAVEDGAAADVKERVRNKKSATLQFIALTIERQHELSSRVPPPGGPEYNEFLERAFVSASDEFTSLWHYLAYLEDLAVGVNSDVFDYEVVKQSIGDRFYYGWVSNKAWIGEQRSRHGRPLLFEQVSRVAAQVGPPPTEPKQVCGGFYYGGWPTSVDRLS